MTDTDRCQDGRRNNSRPRIYPRGLRKVPIRLEADIEQAIAWLSSRGGGLTVQAAVVQMVRSSTEYQSWVRSAKRRRGGT